MGTPRIQKYNSMGHFVGCRGMVVVQSPEILPVKRWEPNDYPARTSLCWKLGRECPGPVNCCVMSKSCGQVASCFVKWCGSQQQRQILSSSRPMAVSLSARAPIQHQLCCMYFCRGCLSSLLLPPFIKLPHWLASVKGAEST